MSGRTTVKSRRSGWRVCAALLCAVLCLPLTPSQGFAQEQRRTLFEMLFGRPVGREGGAVRDYQPRSRRDFPAPPRERSVTRPQPARKAPSVVQMRTATSEPAEKLENARRVLVIGDFLAGGMGEELATAFAASPAITVDVRANGSSGLVRTDYYDWFANLPQFIAETNPATIVIMLGSNDRQQMQIGDNREKFGTDIWFKEYERRIDELLTLAGRPKVPLLWVGLPAFQSPALTADIVGFNRLYRSHVEKAGGEFVDVWDGFVDEAGKFVVTGYDMNGQQARLREADGVGVTQAGKRKLAFYVEKFVRRHLDSAGPDLVKLDGSNLPALTSLPALGIDAGEVRTQPISLTDPDLDGGDKLLGEAAPAAGQSRVPVVESPRDRLTKRGEMSDAPAGRIDDYRLVPDTAQAKQ